MRKGNKTRYWLPVFVLIFLVLACTMPGSISTEDQIRTQIALTQANQPSVTVSFLQETDASPTVELLLPSATHTMTTAPSATLTVTATFTESPAGGDSTSPDCNIATHVADVTVPDNTEFAPGTAFDKTWRLKNVGTCTWTTSYEAVFSDGDKMSGPNDINLTKSVAPGETIDITVSLKAPTTPGTYRGNWKLRDANGNIFGLTTGGPFFVIIKVVSP